MHRALCRCAAAGLVACATLPPPAASAQDEIVLTAIDHYVRLPDPSYCWKVVSSGKSAGVNFLILDMVSQNWLTPQRVDRTEWRHLVTLAYPDELRSTTGFLMIGGGKNGGDPPRAPDEMTMQIAKATGTVVAELKQVPNQPLIFQGDGKPRVEDDLIGYTWDQYIKTGDPTWLARNAMVKSAVRAMDAAAGLGRGQVASPSPDELPAIDIHSPCQKTELSATIGAKGDGELRFTLGGGRTAAEP